MPKTQVPMKCQAPGCEKERRRKSRYCSVECYFWSRIDRSAGTDGCWMWTGSVNAQNGYGDVDDHTAGGKRTSAHRHAYRLTYSDPGKLSVLHECDNRLCCRPDHLRLGTALDNWEDSLRKGRQTVVLPGEANGSAKLTAAEVRAIRRFAASAVRVVDLVRKFGVHDSTIRRVLSGQTWGHVPDDPEVIYYHGTMERSAPAMQRSA
jgi:hypothetical protein